MNLKTRDRTTDELSVRKKEFLKICDILDKTKINYFLQSGILLGAIRDKDLIKWDWDIEISVFSEEFLPNIDSIVKLLEENEFKITNINKNEKESKIDFIGEYPENVTGYTIWSWNYSKIKDVYWRRELSLPAKYLKNFSKIDFLGRKFNCPNNPEEYLSFAYGNWRIPLRSSEKASYMSKNFRNNRKFIQNNLKQKFLKFIYDLWNSIKK
tara:strand:+ start:245 stop:877 length:633 start_codon:yes stop_codon:yes gene_type:complete